MDPLSDVLALLKPRTSISAGLAAGGEWAVRFPMHEGIKFNAVMRGACWVSVDGDPAPHCIEEGDCFLLTKGRPFTFATDLSLAAIDPSAIYDNASRGIATLNGGGDFFLIGGRYTFGENADILLGVLPPVVHVRKASTHASVLRWALDRLAAELSEGQPGGHLVCEHLAHIMLVQVLRIYLAGLNGAGAGWLHALGDRQLSRVVGAIHADPARRWTLVELARIAGMSRSIFAHRFKRTAGVAPMEYVTRWRMLLAGDRLRSSSDSISSIARSVGYQSESAFSTAFRRTMSCSPRQFQRTKAAG